MRADRVVEPTNSENITVTCRRSARLAAETLLTSAGDATALVSLGRTAIASSSLRRCPSAVTPSSLRSSAVRFGRTVSSISFSRNAASYCPRPRLRSQTTTSMMAPELRLAAYHRRSGPERSWEASGSERAGEPGAPTRVAQRPLGRSGFPELSQRQQGHHLLGIL